MQQTEFINVLVSIFKMVQFMLLILIVLLLFKIYRNGK